MEENSCYLKIDYESEGLTIRISRNVSAEEAIRLLHSFISLKAVAEEVEREQAKQRVVRESQASEKQELQARIRKALRGGKARSRGELCQELDCKPRTLMGPLLRLVEERRVIRTGKKRGTKYRLNARPKLKLAKAG